MSETPRTDEAELREYYSNPESPKVVYADFARIMERNANRWRSVAEQAEKALRQWDAAYGEHCPVEAAAIRLDASDLTDKALAAFDSLRKEQSND